MTFSESPESIENRFNPSEDSLKPHEMVDMVEELRDRLDQRVRDARRLTYSEVLQFAGDYVEPSITSLYENWEGLERYRRMLDLYVEDGPESEYMPEPIEPSPASDINSFSRALSAYAEAHDIALQGVFNTVVVTVVPGETPGKIFRSYWQGMDQLKAAAEKES